MYKLKIYCTAIKQLSFNNCKITKKIYKDIILRLQLHNFSFVDKLYILYKHSNDFTVKSIEFSINRELTEIEITEFIKILQTNGFSSKHNTAVQFIEISTNNVIYSYDFTTLNRINDMQQNRHKNKSSYTHNTLYIK